MVAGDEKAVSAQIAVFVDARTQFPGDLDPCADTINYPDPKTGMTALMHAAQKGNAKIVNELLQARANVADVNPKNIKFGKPKSVFEYIDYKDKKGIEAYTTLLLYCNQQQPKLIAMLERALFCALTEGEPQYLQVFLQHISDPDLTSIAMKVMPLYTAAANGCEQQFAILLERKIGGINSVDIAEPVTHRNVVHMAVSNSDRAEQRLKIIAKLIEIKAKIDEL